MNEIRRATISDLDVLSELFDQYRIFYLQESDRPAARAFIKERLEKNDSMIWIALSDKKPAGFAQLYPSFSSVSMKRLWILNDLFVHADFRRKRLAQELIVATESFAKENSIGLTLKTARDNEAAQSLYQALGWKRDEQFVSYNIRFKPTKES